MKRLTSSVLAGLGGLALLAGAPAQALTLAQDTATEPGAPPPQERIRLINVNGYSVIDREHVVLNGGASRHYLVTLRHRCSGLRSGVRIATSFPATTTLHPPYIEYIHVGDSISPMGCAIQTVEEVESVDAARTLVADRAAAAEAAEEAENADDTPSLR